MLLDSLIRNQSSWIILIISTANVALIAQVDGLSLRGSYIDAWDRSVCGNGNHDAGEFTPAYCGSKDELRTNHSRETWSHHYGDRIAGGQYASKGDFPSFARVNLYWKGRIGLRCAGTIIHRNLVLSAAHCWTLAFKKLQPVGLNIEKTEVMVGDVNENSGNWQRIGVKKVCLNPFHMKYVVQDLGQRPGYDSAILKLDRDIEYNRYARPACVETRVAHREQATCYAIGMGRINDGGAKDGRLKYIELKRNCLDGPNGRLYEQEARKTHASTCYKTPGAGTSCIGDSGGPLICMDDCNRSGPRQYVAGINSFGTTFNNNGQRVKAKCTASDNKTANYMADVSKLDEDDGWTNLLQCAGY